MLVGIKSLPVEIVAMLIWLLSFVVTYVTIPRIIFLVKAKSLLDNPNERSSHKEVTPTLGGIAFFLSLVLSLFCIGFFYENSQVALSVVVGLTILFFIGVKDDLIALSPRTKILSQLIASGILLSNTDFWLQSFDGFLGIGTIPLWLGMAIGCFIILSVVNSFNLIDGINGSASMVGITVFTAFAYLFFSAGIFFFAFLSLVGIAFLLAFLRYNLSTDKRIFMGDTGSLIVGFVIGVLMLRFLALDKECLQLLDVSPANKFALVIATFFVPFVDTLRVFTIRIFKHGKPFLADRSHVHHLMIDFLHLSHGVASLLLGIVNLFSFCLVFFLSQRLHYFALFFIMVIMVLCFAGLCFYYNRSLAVRKKKYKIRKALQKEA